MEVPQPLQQLCNILKAIANMEGQQPNERSQPLIDKEEAKELALGIARLVEARAGPMTSEAPKKTLVDSEELARQVDADFTCFLCRKRCRTKARFLTHFRSHFKAAGISRKRRRNDEDFSTVETSDDETSNDDSLKDEPLHMRGVENNNDIFGATKCRQRRKRKHHKSSRVSKLLPNLTADPDGDSGCHSIDDDCNSSTYSSCSAFSDCPGDSESSESESGEPLPHSSKKFSSKLNLVTLKDRLSLAEKQLDNNETEGLVCLTCLKRFSNCQNLRRHLRLHIARDSVTPDFEKSALPGDLGSDDADFDGRYFCDWCPARFDNRSAARVHENSHKGQETKCYICDKSYADRYSLRYHLRTHGIGRQIRCEYCNKSFSKPSRLEAHVRAQHDNIREFDCLQCGKKFKTRVHLLNHSRRHSGERPFACVICSDRFRHKASLIAHMRSHVGSRPYCCEVCGKTFREPSTLKAHCRVHTGDKPYRCNLCDKSFTQRAGLNYHKKSHDIGALTSSTTMPTPLPSPPIQSGDAIFQMSPLPSFDNLKSSPSPSSTSESFTYKSMTSEYTRDVTPPQTPPSAVTCTPPMSTNSTDFSLSTIDENEENDILPALNISEITHQLDFTEPHNEENYYNKSYVDEHQHNYRQQLCQHQQHLMQQQQQQQQQWFQHPYHMQHELQQQQQNTSGAYSSSAYDYSNQSYDFSNTTPYQQLNQGLPHHHQHLQHQHHQQVLEQNHFNSFNANGYSNSYGHSSAVSTVTAALAASNQHSHHQPVAGYCL